MCGEIEVVFYVLISGLVMFSIEVWIMNKFVFLDYIKRIFIWGLGCVGGVSGFLRVYEYCKVFLCVKVFVLFIEFCSLIF